MLFAQFSNNDAVIDDGEDGGKGVDDFTGRQNVLDFNFCLVLVAEIKYRFSNSDSNE